MATGADTDTMTTHTPTTDSASDEVRRLMRLFALVLTVALLAGAYLMVKRSMDQADRQRRCIVAQSVHGARFGARDPVAPCL
jgi:hypothetical protein